MAGKLFGAMIGFGAGLLLVSSWWMAAALGLVGAIAGHFFYDQAHDPTPTPQIAPSLADLGLADTGPLPDPQTRAELEAEARQRFAQHVCGLFAAVAQADGEPVRDEVRAIREYFEESLGFRAAELDGVRISLKEALASPRELSESLRACRDELPAADRLMLLSALYELALSDGDLRRSERDVINRIADGLDVSTTEHRSIRAIHFPDASGEYARLGLEVTATDEEVKSAFRQLAVTHHPDRVAHLGVGAVEVASRHFRELKDAYDAIRKLRGL